MEINEIKQIIEKHVKRKGYRLEERKSISTGSWYFKIYSAEVSLLFRVSDHKTKKDIITLRLDHKLTREAVIRFTNNRCEDLSYRRLKTLLGLTNTHGQARGVA